MPIATRPEAIVAGVEDVSDVPLTEIIDGILVEMPPTGTYPVEIATRLALALGVYVRDANLGRVIIEALFRLDEKTQHRPDLAFVSDWQWPKGRRAPNAQPWEIVPELAVEVVSETDRAWAVLSKVDRYFKAGTKQVWLIYPHLEAIHVYLAFAEIRVLTRPDTLEGGDLIPGFRLPLEELFEGEAEAEGEPLGPDA